MSEQIHPIFAVRGDLKDHQHVSTWTPASPWPNADVAFHWTNFDYPRAHTHEYWEILILVSGTLSHEINGIATTLTSHQAYLIRPEDCHRFYAIGDEPVIILNMMAKKTYVNQLLATYGDSIAEKIYTSKNLSFNVSDTIFNKCVIDTQVLQLDSTISIEEKVERCRILFVGLIAELMLQNISKPKPQWLSHFLMKLSQSNLSNLSIKTDLMAESTYSYSRTICLFKKYMGCTIAQYITHLRVEQAKDYLKNTNMRIIDVSAAVGCDNVTHFNRIFKSATGITPTEFRKNNTRISGSLEKDERPAGRTGGRTSGRTEEKRK